MTRRPALANLFDALPSNSSLVDATGRIVLVNDCWRAFADDNDLNDPTYCLGQSYYAVCEKAAAAGEATGAEMAAGLRDVIAGRRAIFRLTYPCAPPGRRLGTRRPSLRLTVFARPRRSFSTFRRHRAWSPKSAATVSG